MSKTSLLVISGLLFMASACAAQAPSAILEQNDRFGEVVSLPDPDRIGTTTLEQALQRRRSQRDYASEELPVEIVGQLFWASQGVTDDAGHRTAPSAGALYPLELYALTSSTFTHYLPEGHRFEQRAESTTLESLTAAAFDQGFVGSAPTVLVITGVQARTEAKYGAVANDLMNREAGHAAQNILLEATVLDLATVPVGGFDPAEVARLLALPLGEEVLYLLPVGFPA